MARLTKDQAIQILKEPKNDSYIQQARLQEERLVFHCEPVMETLHLPHAYNRFIKWVEQFLPKEKMKRFIPLLTCPIETVQSTATIFTELSKVYEADNKYIKFDFVNDEIENDANEYQAKIGDTDFWKTEGFKALQTGINDLLIVDLPSVQKTERPEPYYYLLSISRIVDVMFFMDGAVSYVAFQREQDGKYVVIDEETYFVISKDEDSGNYTVDIESKHSSYTEDGTLIDGLGHAPARSFYDNPIVRTKRINKNGPLSKVLSKLDWLLFWRVSIKYFELYAAWPIMVSYKRTCNYKDEDHNECVEGYVNYSVTQYVELNGESVPQIQNYQKVCPVCAAQSNLGPGTKWEVDAPRDKEDVDLMENPIKYVEVATDKLDFVVGELERLENEIYLDVVGWDGDAITKESVNEKQVQAGFVSKEAVLDNIKGYLEESQKFAMDNVFALRYGSYFLGSTVDWGNNYFLKSEAELTKEYSDMKLSGLPSFMISDAREKINRTANKNNTERLERNAILEQLEPYLDYKMSDLQTMQIATIDPEGYILKLNFNNFIQRFEREQMNVVQFGSLLPFNTKIDIIKNTLLSYGKEKTAAIPRDEPRTN